MCLRPVVGDTACSRGGPGSGSFFGKRTEDVRSKVSPLTKDALEKLWRSLGYDTESAWLADLLDIVAHGQERVASLQRERLRRVAGIGRE